MLFELLWGYLAFVNIATFGAFAFDKIAAQNGWWRLSEASLLSLAFIGGSLGALIGQRVMRHKTQKQPFRSLLIAIVSFHIVMGILLFVPGIRAALLG